MMKNFANVGITRNLAQSLLLYTKLSRFLQTFCLIKNDKYLTRKLLCKTMHSAKSAKVCNSCRLLIPHKCTKRKLTSTNKTEHETAIRQDSRIRRENPKKLIPKRTCHAIAALIEFLKFTWQIYSTSNKGDVRCWT